MSTVDLPGRNPHYDSGSRLSRSRYERRAKGYDLQENLPRMRNQGDSPVITAIGRVFLLVQHLNNRVLPKLWYRSLLPDPYDDTVERREKTGARPHPELQQLSWEIIRSHCLRVGYPSQCKYNFSARWWFTQGMAGLELRQAMYDRGVEHL